MLPELIMVCSGCRGALVTLLLLLLVKLVTPLQAPWPLLRPELLLQALRVYRCCLKALSRCQLQPSQLLLLICMNTPHSAKQAAQHPPGHLICGYLQNLQLLEWHCMHACTGFDRRRETGSCQRSLL
jgi:hypothetical protein